VNRWSFAAVLALAAAAVLPTPSAQAAPAVDNSIAGITGVGVHNAYVQATFPWLIDALESGASMLELDVWQNFLGSRAYWAGHDPGNANNCSSATTFGALRTGSRNQSFQTCLRNIRLWHDQNPNHAPVILKVEMKNGFDGTNGFGPAQFDTLLTNALGEVRLEVDPRCGELIKDLEEVMFKQDSGVIDKVRDPRRTHASDALGYAVWQLFGDKPKMGEINKRLF